MSGIPDIEHVSLTNHASKNMIMETVTILQDVGRGGRLGTVRRPEMEDGRSFEYHGLRVYEEMP